MRQRNTWTTAEDATVRERMTAAIVDNTPLRTVADELSHTLPHPVTSILQRWYRVLSSDSERVKGRVDRRVAWNSRFPRETVALIRAMADATGRTQNDIVESALRVYVELESKTQRRVITTLQQAHLEAMNE